MTNHEYDNELRQIENEYKDKKFLLIKRYINSNNKIRKGDFVEDHIGKIRVGQISSYIGNYTQYPQVRFYGQMFKRDGAPRKDGKYRWVYEQNIIT